MRATTRVILGLLSAMTGTALFAVFMMVWDELFSLAMYCGKTCLYPFPWSEGLALWTAWVWTFSVIVAGVMLMNIGVALVISGVMSLRRFDAA